MIILRSRFKSLPHQCRCIHRTPAALVSLPHLTSVLCHSNIQRKPCLAVDAPRRALGAEYRPLSKFQRPLVTDGHGKPLVGKSGRTEFRRIPFPTRYRTYQRNRQQPVSALNKRLRNQIAGKATSKQSPGRITSCSTCRQTGFIQHNTCVSAKP